VDAFQTLKADGLLEKVALPKETLARIPAKIGNFPLHDSDGSYWGFAVSGYGLMWNTRYLALHKLPAPREWTDVADPRYFGHLVISAPSRSGTTHLTIEVILQAYGWEKGWALLLQTGGQPIDFAYPSLTSVVPASVAVVKNGPHPANARAFVEYLLGDEGQLRLFAPEIGRLPVIPALYVKAPKGYPNPFAMKLGGVDFDDKLSSGRRNIVNSLFDHVITFRHAELKAAWGAIHAADAQVAKAKGVGRHVEGAVAQLAEARRAASAVPLDARRASDQDVNAALRTSRT
jgi:ABC-type Fe3+ transport system substrate-binding protein